MSRQVIIKRQPEGKCDLCGKKAETRPYGPNGENVCFDCGMKNEEAAKRQMCHRTFGESFPRDN